MNKRVLLVDDESRILQALERRLGREFEIHTAVGGDGGVSVLKERGPFAVVVSDLRMPGMNGVEFLTRVKGLAPDTIRVLLTGQPDMESAIDGVNEGNIFRFLTKPCPAEVLEKALRAGVEQYRLVHAERELLENTLLGSISVLTEMLGIMHPAAFHRAFRLRRYVVHMSTGLRLEDLWQFESAALLSQIGCITLPIGILDQLGYAGTMSAAEQRMFVAHPAAAKNLLSRIHRLEPVARMIERQQWPFRSFDSEANSAKGQMDLGAQMLHVALGFDQLLALGYDSWQAAETLRNQTGEYNPDLLRVLESFVLPEMDMAQRTVRLSDLRPAMVINADVRARSGLVLMAKGEPVTSAAIERLKACSSEIGIVEPIIVLAPRTPCDDDSATVPSGRCEG